MAVPKHKTSKQRTHSRGANFKISPPSLGECSHCHELKQSHRVCPNCGYYNDKPMVEIKQDKE